MHLFCSAFSTDRLNVEDLRGSIFHTYKITRFYLTVFYPKKLVFIANFFLFIFFFCTATVNKNFSAIKVSIISI